MFYVDTGTGFVKRRERYSMIPFSVCSTAVQLFRLYFEVQNGGITAFGGPYDRSAVKKIKVNKRRFSRWLPDTDAACVYRYDSTQQPGTLRGFSCWIANNRAKELASYGTCGSNGTAVSWRLGKYHCCL